MGHGTHIAHKLRRAGINVPGFSSSDPAASSTSAAGVSSSSSPAAATTASSTAAATTSAAAATTSSSSRADPQTTSSTEAAEATTTSSTLAAQASTTSTTSSAAAAASTTSTTPSTTSSSTSSTTGRNRSTASSSALALSTSTIILSSVASNTLSAATLTVPSASAKSSSSSSGPGAGEVVGIVGGAIVGVVVLSAMIGYLFRSKFSRKDEDESPFDKEEFRRTSMMLQDSDNMYGTTSIRSGAHSPQMSEYSMSAMHASSLGRNNTVLPGLARNGMLANPRPPSSIVSHYQHQHMVPSLQPGHIMPAGAYYGGGPGGMQGPPRPYYGHEAPAMDMYGGYPMPISQQKQLDRYAAPQAGTGYGLSRNGTMASNYSNGTAVPAMPSQGQQPRELYDGGLAHVREEAETPSRSGTPTNANVQQSYFSHRPDSGSSAVGAKGNFVRAASEDGGRGSAEVRDQRGMMERDARAQRTLSVRNGGLDSIDDDDPYGGCE